MLACHSVGWRGIAEGAGGLVLDDPLWAMWIEAHAAGLDVEIGRWRIAWTPLLGAVMVTSRPLLLSGIGRLTSHAGQAQLSITPMHVKAKRAHALLTAVSEKLKAWKSAAQQLPLASVWQRVCEFIVTHVTGFNWLSRRPSPQLVHCTWRQSPSLG